MIKPVCYDSSMEETVIRYSSSKPIDSKCWNKNDADIKKIKKHIKDHYIKAQNYTCPYCAQRLVVKHNAAWDVDHIIPKSSHPEFLFVEKNLCVTCKDCNLEKSNKNVLCEEKVIEFPEESCDYIFVHPHFDEYSKHVDVVKEALVYRPITEKGVKTIQICGLQRFYNEYLDSNFYGAEANSEIVKMNDSIQDSSTLDLDAIKSFLKNIKSISEAVVGVI